jgi:hypothetical protein
MYSDLPSRSWPALMTYEVRDLNDEISKLMREKRY